MVETAFVRNTPVNSDVLDETLRPVLPTMTGIIVNPRLVRVLSTVALTGLEVTTAQGIIDAHNPATTLTEQQKVDAARAAIQSGKQYLAKQLIKSGPDSPAQIVSVLKPAVDGNEYLLNMMTNQLTVMNIAYAWLVLDINLLLNPTNAANRQRYILAAQAVIGMLGG